MQHCLCWWGNLSNWAKFPPCMAALTVPSQSTHRMDTKPQQRPLFKRSAPLKIAADRPRGLQHPIGQLLSLWQLQSPQKNSIPLSLHSTPTEARRHLWDGAKTTPAFRFVHHLPLIQSNAMSSSLWPFFIKKLSSNCYLQNAPQHVFTCPICTFI